jgi:hypothetical protein
MALGWSPAGIKSVFKTNFLPPSNFLRLPGSSAGALANEISDFFCKINPLKL